MNMTVFLTYFLLTLLTTYLGYWCSKQRLHKLPAFIYWPLFWSMMLIELFHYYILSDKQFIFFESIPIKDNELVLITALLFLFINVFLIVKIVNKRSVS